MEGSFLDMKDIYYLVKSLFSVQISLPQIYQTIADYMVERGYDDEDLAALGVNRGASLVYNLVIANPQLNNLNFIVHVQNFVRENIDEFS